MKNTFKLTGIIAFAAVITFTACGSNPAAAQTPASSGASYYVRANGNDTNAGTGENAPFKTLAKAVEMASRGTVKKITVIGKLVNVAIEIVDSGETEILITGKQNPSEQEKAVISAAKGDNGLTIIGKSNIRFEFITFTNATAAMFVIQNGPVVTLADGVIVTNNSSTTGAGMFIDNNATVRLTGNVQIINNRAQSGGGIFLQENSTLIVEGNVLIASNTAEQRNGGAINAQDSKITIQGNARIIDNEAQQTGGGINLAGNNGSSAVIGGNAIISGNKAREGGGVIIWDDCTVTITDNAQITANTAGRQGGGVKINGGRLIQNGGKISGNTSPHGSDISDNYQ